MAVRLPDLKVVSMGPPLVANILPGLKLVRMGLPLKPFICQALKMVLTNVPASVPAVNLLGLWTVPEDHSSEQIFPKPLLDVYRAHKQIGNTYNAQDLLDNNSGDSPQLDKKFVPTTTP